MKHAVKNFFDDYSKDFSLIYGSRKNALQLFIDQWLRKSMWLRYNLTMQACNPLTGMSVLDIGCGPGNYCIALAQRGAATVVGIDFAPQMIDIAQNMAKQHGLEHICSFKTVDFYALNPADKFDYLIVMGVMDYISEPEKFIDKTLQIAQRKIMFSFPAAGGFLAWQRKIRYKHRCPLYLYSKQQLTKLFGDISPWKCTILQIHRDYFVTLERSI